MTTHLLKSIGKQVLKEALLRQFAAMQNSITISLVVQSSMVVLMYCRTDVLLYCCTDVVSYGRADVQQPISLSAKPSGFTTANRQRLASASIYKLKKAMK